MEQLLNQIITLAACYGVMGIGYLAWLSSGIINAKYINKHQWSWQIFWEDVLKLLAHAGSLLLFTLGMNLLEWIVLRMGGDISVLADKCSVAGLAIMTVKSSAGYYAKAYKNYQTFHEKRYSDEVSLELDPAEVNWGAVAEDVKDFVKSVADALTPKHLQTEQQTDEDATLSDAEITEVLEAEGRGEDINPLNRILPDGDNDGGKGWQCSKYAGYLATGKRQYSIKNPDYGPVNGRDMVDYLIRTFGWVECKKQNGAIFSYNTGQYGHTGIVKDAKNNIVNDANWQPLRVGTHYLNLDAVGARYACPKSMVISTTNSVDKTPQTANTKPVVPVSKPVVSTGPNTGKTYVDKPLIYHKGEMVVPLRKIDYDGRHLRQYDDKYYVVQDVPEGCDRVVLGARGQIWAAMRAEDIKRV